MKTRLITLIGFIFAAALTRLIPHPWNFTAIGAVALFGGSQLQSRWQSLVIPFAALLLTDLILGFHGTMVFVYAAFCLTVMLGWTLTERTSIFRLATYSLAASSLFFVITNFGVWMIEPMYAHTFEGLMECYWMAIPFFGNQIAGDLFYVGVLFSAFALAKSFVPSLNQANA